MIDDSVLVKMIEGESTEDKSKEMLELISHMKKEKDLDVKFITTINSLLRAIWKAKSDVPITHLQDILEFFDIAPLKFHEYKNEEEVRKEIITLANIMVDPKEFLRKFMKNGKK